VFFNQNVSASRRAPLASMVNNLRDSLQKYIKINSVRVLKMLLFSETKGEKSWLDIVVTIIITSTSS